MVPRLRYITGRRDHGVALLDPAWPGVGPLVGGRPAAAIVPTDVMVILPKDGRVSGIPI